MHYIRTQSLNFHDVVCLTLFTLQEVHGWPAASCAGTATHYTYMGRFQSWQLAPSCSEH